jgi:hypothetical protein
MHFPGLFERHPNQLRAPMLRASTKLAEFAASTGSVDTEVLLSTTKFKNPKAYPDEPEEPQPYSTTVDLSEFMDSCICIRH